MLAVNYFYKCFLTFVYTCCASAQSNVFYKSSSVQRKRCLKFKVGWISGGKPIFVLSVMTGNDPHKLRMSTERRKPRWWPANKASDIVCLHLQKHLMTELNQKLTKYMPQMFLRCSSK